jgi:hypothetical protein
MAAKACEIRTLADLQKVLLGFVADANMEESSMRSIVLLSPVGDRATISRLDLVKDFPELKMLL